MSAIHEPADDGEDPATTTAYSPTPIDAWTNSDATPASRSFTFTRSSPPEGELMRSNGWRLWEPLAPLLAGRAHLSAGDPARARAELDRAVVTARSAGATGTLLLARAIRDQALILSGRQPRSTAAVDESVDELAAMRAENRGLLALRSRREGVAASEAFAGAVARWRELGITSALVRALALQAEAERREGNRRRANGLASEAERILDSLKTPQASRGPLMTPLEVVGSR